MQLPSWVPGKEQWLISTQEVPAEWGYEKKGGRRQKMPWETKRQTMGQNVGARKTRAGIEKGWKA